MTLEDNRPAILARLTVLPTFAPVDIAAELLRNVSAENPDIEVSSVHFTTGTDGIGEYVELTARCGPLTPEATDAAHDASVAAALAGTRLAGPCSSCHQLAQRPPTEYCQTPEAHQVQP